MEWIAVFRDKLKVLFHRRQFDRDLEEELRFHLEAQARDNHENGMSDDEARRAARLHFGNTTLLKEAAWHAWGWAPLERLLQDLRFALRSLRRSPTFALSVVLLLALAIWMNTTMYTVIHAVMLAPLPFDHSEQLVQLYETNPQKGEVIAPVEPANFVDWRADARSFSVMAATAGFVANLTGSGDPQELRVAWVTEEFFQLLGVRPAAGRTLLAEDYASAAQGMNPTLVGVTAVIISHDLWQRSFGGDLRIIGSSIQLDHRTLSIVGVMPASFNSVDLSWGKTDCWVPLSSAGSQRPSYRHLTAIARLVPGVSIREAQAEMDVLARRLEAKRPERNQAWGVRVFSLRDAVAFKYRLSLFILGGAVGLVLLIACANVANLMLARGAARMREVATRSAIGAGRLRLTQQLATESLLLSLSAGALGVLMSFASVRGVLALAPQDLPRLDEVSVNGTVLGFCFLVAVATGLICGVLPALRISRFDLSAALKDGGAASASRARGHLSRVLVVSEVAASLVLLISAGLLARSFAKVQALELGFQPDHVLRVGFSPDRTKYGSLKSTVGISQDLLPRLQGIPGVEAAAIGQPPLAAGTGSAYYAEGSSEKVICGLDAPSAQYFRALRIPVLKGRVFAEQDGAESEPVAILNRTAAQRTWPGENPIGRKIRFDEGRKGVRWLTVVGVVADVRAFGLEAEPRPYVYVPLAQTKTIFAGNLVIRTSGDPRSVLPAVRAAIWSLDNQQPVTRITTLEELLSSTLAPRRFNTLLMTVFAALAFLLAASGVYSLMSYTVTLRTREMSIRMALGADRADILRLIVRNGAVLVGIGVALGLAGALGAVRFLSSLLFQIKPQDPLAFAASTALLVLTALAACYIPARRAASVDVMKTLRQE